jgi:uncharacterized protein (DUF2236 family)
VPTPGNLIRLPDAQNNPVSRTFRRVVSGDPQGRPAWVRALEEGDDAGLFGPGSAPWAVHGSLTTLVGGIRALLLQALHPGALAGVRNHSRYQDDPLGRLAGTTRWLVTLTFGDTAAVERESMRVRTMHDKVRGTYASAEDPNGASSYSADDPHLLRWVHLAFTDSFLTTHQVWGGPIPGGPDAYVGEWAKAAVPLGLADPPRSAAELASQLRSFDDELQGGPDAREVVRFVMNPPLPIGARPAYAVLAAGAVSTMDPHHRELLGLPNVPARPARIATRTLLAGMRWTIGDTSPSEQAARTRLTRLAQLD